MSSSEKTAPVILSDILMTPMVRKPTFNGILINDFVLYRGRFFLAKASKGIDKNILGNIKVKIGEGISGEVMEKGSPVIVRDVESESFARKNSPRYKTKSFISIPLKVGFRTIGVINISDKITGAVFSEEDLQMLLSFASYASIALERGTYYRMTEDLKKISVTDALTELFNRRYFH